MFIEAAFNFLARKKAPKTTETSAPSKKDLKRLNAIWDEEYTTATGRVRYVNSCLRRVNFSDTDQQVLTICVAAGLTSTIIEKDKRFKNIAATTINSVEIKALERNLAIISETPSDNSQQLSQERKRGFRDYIETANDAAEIINNLWITNPDGRVTVPFDDIKIRIAIAAPLHRMHLAQTGE